MFQLQIATTDITDGTIAVSWCVDQETLATLAKQQIKDPQVVICIAPVENYHSYRETRKIVPLQDLMTYLEFRSSGENRIWAFISEMPTKEAKTKYLARENGDYKTSVLSYSGEAWSSNFKYDVDKKTHFPGLPSEPLSVMVPEGVFAKEPAKWEKTWVNHWFRQKAVDQCDFRKRRILAYTLQPLVVLLDVLVLRVLFLLFSTIWLSRGFSLKYLVHPLRYNLADTIYNVSHGSSWAFREYDDSQDVSPAWSFRYVWFLVQNTWRFLLLPPVLAVGCVLTHFHLWKYVGIGFGLVVAGILLAVAMLYLIKADWTHQLVNRYISWMDARDKKKSVFDPWYLKQEEMEYIVCSPNTKAYTSVSELPARHRTIHLRFQDLKARVCKPFSR